MWTLIRTASFGLALTLGSVVFTPHVHAKTGQSNAYTVSYHPGELNTSQGAENIISRIHQTANKLCVHDFGPERYTKKIRVKHCLADVTQDLVDQIDDKNLDIAHAKILPPEKLDMRAVKDSISYAKRADK